MPIQAPWTRERIHVLTGPSFLEIARAVLERGARFRFRASGNSMHPFIRNGDHVVLVPLSPPALPRLGDVVLASHPHNGNPLVHRIVKRSGSGYLLRGDNCPDPDGLVERVHILAKAVAVERNGRTRSLGLGAERRILGPLVGTGLYFLLKRCAHRLIRRGRGPLHPA